MKHFSNDDLILELKKIVTEETRLTSRVLDYLKEVESRKLFLKMGYASLFEFCIKELKYSEGSAQRRISAMRLIKEVPEVREKIISGDLSLSVVSQAQSFFRDQQRKQTPLNRQEKLEVLRDIENTSTRECEKKLLKLSPEQVKKDRERAVTDELTELKLTVDQEFMRMLEELKNILSHAKPNASTKEILKLSMIELLEKKKPKAKAKPKPIAKSKSNTQSHAQSKTGAEADAKAIVQEKVISEKSINESEAPPAPAVGVKMKEKIKNNKRSRHINIHLKQAVMNKHDSQCCYQDAASGRRCTAKRSPECDHVIPLSKGGQTTFENLQVLCSAHNKLKSNHL